MSRRCPCVQHERRVGVLPTYGPGVQLEESQFSVTIKWQVGPSTLRPGLSSYVRSPNSSLDRLEVGALVPPNSK